jgi:hypothetical protein
MRLRAHISLPTSLQLPSFYLLTQTRSSRYVAVYTNLHPSSLCRASAPKFPVSLFYLFFSICVRVLFKVSSSCSSSRYEFEPDANNRRSRFTRPSSIFLFFVSSTTWVKATWVKTVKWNRCPPFPRPVFCIFLNCLYSGRLSNPCSTQMSTTLTSHVYRDPRETTSCPSSESARTMWAFGPFGA